MAALMLAEAEAATKLDERLNQLESNIEDQNEMLNRIYTGVGSVSSAM